MTTSLNGRELLYGHYIQNKDQCRQALEDIRNKAETEKRNWTDDSGHYNAPDMPVLDKIRLGYAKQLSEVFFGSDAAKAAAFMNFLKDKVTKKPPGDLPVPFSWQKLFDKILDPEKEMKSLEGKRTSQNVKESDVNQIYGLFERYNREIAQLNFRQLAAEIDDRDSKVSDFKNALREWARNSSNQPEGPRLQELFTIKKFAEDFIDWQNDLVQELKRSFQGHPRPAFKPQVCLLRQKLIAFLTEVVTFQNDQKMDMNRHRALSPEFHDIIALPWHALGILRKDGVIYDEITQGMAIPVPDDFARLLQQCSATPAKLVRIP